MQQILLVEDSLDYQQIAMAVLGRDYQVTIASSLEDARKKMDERSFDLVLLDATLPDGDAFDFCAVLKKDEVDLPPVFFLTGRADRDERLPGFSLDAHDYILKPFHPLELQARVQNRLRPVACPES